jgi:hypothetical protein
LLRFTNIGWWLHFLTLRPGIFLRFRDWFKKFFFTKRRSFGLPTVLTQQHIGSLAVQPTSMSSWSSSFQTLREFFAAQDRGLRFLESPELFPLIGKA